MKSSMLQCISKNSSTRSYDHQRNDFYDTVSFILFHFFMEGNPSAMVTLSKAFHKYYIDTYGDPHASKTLMHSETTKDDKRNNLPWVITFANGCRIFI